MDETGKFEALDQLLAEAREDDMPAVLEARILADARSVQEAWLPPVAQPVRSPLARLREALGGWGGMGGLVAAGVAGLWLGIAPPAIAGDPVGRLIETRQGIDMFDMDNLSNLAAEEQ